MVSIFVAVQHIWFTIITVTCLNSVCLQMTERFLLETYISQKKVMSNCVSTQVKLMQNKLYVQKLCMGIKQSCSFGLVHVVTMYSMYCMYYVLCNEHNSIHQPFLNLDTRACRANLCIKVFWMLSTNYLLCIKRLLQRFPFFFSSFSLIQISGLYVI